MIRVKSPAALLALAFLSNAAFAQERGRLPDGVRLVEDVPYAGTDNPRQQLDILLPEAREGDEPLPVLAFIHGGAWLAGDKRAGRRAVARYVATGKFAGVSIGYRLTDEAIWPAQIHDCKAAIRWLRAHAAEYGLDRERIAVWGSSAGGHLVAMLGVSGDVPELEGTLGAHCDQSSRVACVVDYFGPTDFRRMNDVPGRMNHDAPDSPESRLVGGPIQERPAASRNASPNAFVSPGDAPFLIAHGTADPLVPFNQSELLHAALTSGGVPSVLIPVTDAGHGFRSTELERRVRLFLDKQLLGARDVTISAEPVTEDAPRRPEER